MPPSKPSELRRSYGLRDDVARVVAVIRAENARAAADILRRHRIRGIRRHPQR